MFRGVTVVVNALDLEQGALAHASEWASRLHLPLRAVEWTCGHVEACRCGRTAARPAAVSAAILQALSSTCAGCGVAWDALVWQGMPSVGAQQLFRPFDLCVFGAALPAAVKEMLYEQSLRSPQASVMICPQTRRPGPRVLVLNQHRRLDEAFLETATAVCKAFHVTPVVLTVARTERAARSQERAAQEAFARCGLAVDFDLVAGCDVPTAVARAARWRRCSHVFLERRSPSSWQRWLFGDMMQQLADLSKSLALVAFNKALPSSRIGWEPVPSCG